MILLRRLLGDVLRERRRDQGRTLREVSGAARVSLGYLSEVERGQKEASSELLGSICEALDVPLSEVLREVSDNLALAETLPEVAGARAQHAARHQRRGLPPRAAGTTPVTAARPPLVNGGVDGRSSFYAGSATGRAGSAGTSRTIRWYGGSPWSARHDRRPAPQARPARAARTPSAPAHAGWSPVVICAACDLFSSSSRCARATTLSRSTSRTGVQGETPSRKQTSVL